MAVLGKRKAPEPSISEEDAAAIFRKHFEARFSSLPETKKTKADVAEEADESDSDQDDGSEDDEDEDEEWGGLSENDEAESEDEDEVTTVEVVDHSAAQIPTTTSMSKRELKAFMSSRPPDQTDRSATSTQQPSSSSSAAGVSLPEDAPSLLAQDLELRRLLAESHLLAPSITASGHTVAPKTFDVGRTRHKATDMRVQALGSKLSLHKQDRMPMNMRKGIVAAQDARETKRRREARENGVILERETGKKSRGRSRGRDLAVDRPGVGRLKGAQLRLSERDVRGIEGGRDAFGRRSKR